MRSSTISEIGSQAPTQEEVDRLLEAAGDVVLRLDLTGRVRHASRRTRQLLDLHVFEYGVALSDLAAAEDQALLRARIAQAVTVADAGPALLARARFTVGGKITWFELRLARISGTDGQAELLVIGRDMSPQYATEERLRHLATHDALTDLPNRLLLSDRIRMVISQARRTGEPFVVINIGLDGFKKVNDGLGHPVGDQVLKLAAARMRKTLREADTLARVGGDEFVAILPGTHGDAQIRLVTGRLLAMAQAVFEVDSHSIYIGASIGVAAYPEHAEDEVQLVALADVAMARAKQAGKARCVIYSARDKVAPAHDISLEAAMFQAVREGEFLLYYQPIVDATSRQIQGFETLMRWKHPTLGMVEPGRFICLAENNGLINLLGAWALKAACVQLSLFEQACGRRLYMSVNISPRQFRSEKFLEVLDEALAYSGVRGEQLVLEITEGTLMLDPQQAETILGKMAERRARIAIDDFGTGYSSLAYLKRFPISVLKIDRAFVKDLPQSPKDGAICNAVLDLARHLSLSIVAEGVETEEQLRFFEKRGCQYIQGYLTGRPMPAHVAMTALADNFNALRTGQA